MLGECKAAGGMKIGRGTAVHGENLPYCHFIHVMQLETTLMLYLISYNQQQ
jgi:hypothetical protein